MTLCPYLILALNLNRFITNIMNKNILRKNKTWLIKMYIRALKDIIISFNLDSDKKRLKIAKEVLGARYE